MAQYYAINSGRERKKMVKKGAKSLQDMKRIMATTKTKAKTLN